MQIFALVLALLASVNVVEAQVTDHWKTKEECVAAVDAPNYIPGVKTQRSTGPNEVVLPHPGGCLEMELPDRKGGRGWVRIEAGRPVVYSVADTRKAVALRLDWCDNLIFDEVGFDGKPITGDHFGVSDSVEVVEQSPISESGARMVERIVSSSHGKRSHVDERSLWDRHKGWLIAGAVAGVIVGAFVLAKPMHQEVNNYIGGY